MRIMDRASIQVVLMAILDRLNEIERRLAITARQVRNSVGASKK